MVIGIISRVSSLVIILITAGLFLKQASATSFGTAGRDLGSGLSGTAGGITALINSVLNPVVSLFTGFSSLFNFGTTEQSSQTQNTYGNVRNIPTPTLQGSRVRLRLLTLSNQNQVAILAGVTLALSVSRHI